MAALIIGETLVDLIPANDQQVGITYRPRYGGSPFNVAVGAARLGAEVELATAFGQDSFGRQAAEFLEAEGVGIESSRSPEQVRTCLAVVSTTSGRASYEYYGEFSNMWQILPVPTEQVASAELVHVGSTALDGEPGRETARRAFAEATGICCLDPNPRPMLIPDVAEYRQFLLKLARHADVIKLSIEDIEYLWPDLALDDVSVLLRGEGDAVIIVTRAELSTWVYGMGAAQEVPAVPTELIDPTGAGDSFMASLIADLLVDGKPSDLSGWQTKAYRAAVAASITCSRTGGAEAMPNAREVNEKLARLGGENEVRC